MKIDQNKVVELTYELVVEGKLTDKATQERPLDYIQGTSMLLPEFEKNLEGKEPGDRFEFTLNPEEGYGTVDPNMVLDLPKSAFAVEGVVREELLVVGNVIPMLSNIGTVVQGTVREIKDDVVTMDFNHPLAGKVLNFSGTVLTVREATEKELNEGLHGEYLPPEEGHHCCHKKGGCHKNEGEGCCHGDGEGHGEGCCHGEGKGHEGCHCHKED
ncbi:MAG: peptidylprolyl isomerase [Bacteroidales bacterium]|nr:peptidylprolyl isomerase [Bacteroidales bacterium]